MTKRILAAFAAAASMTLIAGCLGGSGGGFAGNTNPKTQAKGPFTIALSFPQTDAISKLEETGIYSRIGSAIVTDQNGNAAPDGTVVNLDVIDSIIATGVVDSISGTSLTDAGVSLTDGTPAAFTTAAVTRDGTARFIRKDDLLLIAAGSDAVDKNRFVAAAPSLMDSVSVSKAYSQAYPNAVYPLGATSYIVGQALIGASILGVDADGNKTRGVATTTNGVANFVLEFPANIGTIHVGCQDPALDTRYSPTGSADVWIVARLNDDSVTTVNNDACFSSILPWTLEASTETISSTTVIGLDVEDAESIGIPFVSIGVSAVIDVNTGGLTITVASCTTGVGGACSATITVAGGASGDTGTVTFDAGNDATVDVVVQIP